MVESEFSVSSNSLKHNIKLQNTNKSINNDMLSPVMSNFNPAIAFFIIVYFVNLYLLPIHAMYGIHHRNLVVSVYHTVRVVYMHCFHLVISEIY